MAGSTATTTPGGKTVRFDRAATFYDETRGFPPGVEGAVAAGLAEQLGLDGHERVLEVGVGTGRIAVPLRPYVAFYAGVDLSRPMMEVLRRKEGGDRIALLEGDVTRLPFAAGHFDLAIAVLIFHLVGRWRALARELGRVVRPGGAVLINHYEPAEGVTRWWLDLLAEEGARDAVRPVGTRDVEAIGAALAAEGFTGRQEGVAAEWPSTFRPSEAVEAIAKWTWSSTWNIPEPAFSNALAALRARVNEEYPDPDAPRPITGRFPYILFRREG